MWPALNPSTALAYCLTVICLTALLFTLIVLRGSVPTDRPAILRALALVLRALADALCFWRKR